MKYKKGFTLIELLAVIVILAIIALIATPMILRVVENARKSAAQSSALGWIDAVEKQMMINAMDSDASNDIPNRQLTVSYLINTYHVKVKGTAPEGTGTVTIENQKVVSATLKIGKYDITCNGQTCTVSGSSGSSGNSGSGSGGSSSVPTIASCPGCKFAYLSYIDDNNYDDAITPGESLMPSKATSDYTTLTDHPYFFGFVANESTNVVEKIYGCAIKNNVPFCIESSSNSSTYDSSKTLLNSESLYNGVCTEDGGTTSCEDSIKTYVSNDGLVSVGDSSGYCLTGYEPAYCYTN